MSLLIACGPYAFMSLPVFILACAFSISLLPVSRKQPAFRWLLAAYVLLAACMFAVFWIDALGFWGQAIWLAQDALGIGALTSLVAFAYRYPIHRPSLQERRVMGAMVCLLVFVTIISLGYSAIFLWDWRQAEAAIRILQFYPFLLPLTLIATAVVFLHRAIQVETLSGRQQNPTSVRQTLRSIFRPADRSARLLRNFCLAILLGLIQGIPSALGMAGFTHTTMLDSYLIEIGLLLMLSLIGWALLSDATENFSLLNRLVGMLLVIVLFILSTIGLLTTNTDAHAILENQWAQVNWVSKALQANDLAGIPDDVVYVYSVSKNEHPEKDTMYQVRYQRPNLPGASPAFFANQDRLEHRSPQITVPFWDWYIIREMNPLPDPQISMQLRFGDYPVGSTHQYLAYRFSLGREDYEVGFRIFDMQQALHRKIIPWMWVIGLTSLFILVVYPLFIRANLIAPLDRLLAGVKQVNTGNLIVRVPVQYEDEIGFLTRSVNSMVASIASEMHERQQAEEAQYELNERLRALSRQLIQVQEDERRRISHDLHDETGELAIILTAYLKSLQPRLPEGEDRVYLQEILTRVQANLERIRQLAHNLRPPALDTMSFVEALENYCISFAQHSGMMVNFHCLVEIPPIPDSAAISFYRLVQEALTNAARHGHAHRAWVTLDFDSGTLSLSVEDDGQGFDLNAVNAKGAGLQGLCERFLLLGGEVQIESSPGHGTHLTGILNLYSEESQ